MDCAAGSNYAKKNADNMIQFPYGAFKECFEVQAIVKNEA